MDIESKNTKEAGRFRTIFPQILASSTKNLIIVELGLSIGFPTIVIPVLRGLQSERNPDETLFFTDEQASWFGSIAFISQPLGSALSGWLSEPIGRKRAMILFNIPHILSWLMLAFANSSEMVFGAAMLMGLGVGLMEAPIITYVGEICQPSIRGILIACSGVAFTLGSSLVFLLGNFSNWRNIALICLAWPIATMIAICFVPETPLWLLSKKRDDEALLSLRWLRGWVSSNAVENEFTELKRYSDTSSSCVACQKNAVQCSHPPADVFEKIKELSRKRTLRPFAVVMFCFMISQFCGTNAIRAYMVQIVKAFGIPIEANWAIVVVGVTVIVGNIICVCFVRLIGKRRLYFISLVGSSINCFGLGIYALINLPNGFSSFDNHETTNIVKENYLVMIMFLALNFFSVGVASIPWMLLSEVFPFKTRGIASGLTAAISYIMIFINVKTYLSLETTLKLSGTMFFFGSINLIGLCCSIFLLPETEGRTLEEIELFFSDNKRKMFDRHVQKVVKDISLCPRQPKVIRI